MLDSILESICKEIDILSLRMTTSLDNRIILSAIWSATSIIKESNYGFFKIMKEINQIAKDERVVRALSNPDVKVPEDCKALFQNRIKFYVVQSNLSNRCKAKILKFIPKKLYKRLRGRK